MARHLRVSAEDYIYWGVVALAEQGQTSQAEVINQLLGEALRFRAYATPRNVPVPDNEREEAIANAAGFEGAAVEDFREKLISLGWMCWVEDVTEAGTPA